MSAPALIGLDVAGETGAWREAGFDVDGDGVFRVGHVQFRTGVGEAGIAGWTLGAPAVDGGTRGGPGAPHPNGSIVLDHLVVFTDDPDRTTRAYTALGLDVRRVRDIGDARTQTFFRAGEVIVELVGPTDVEGERFFGLAFSVADLEGCARLLGDRLGAIKDATQRGRSIATLRHEACGLTVPIAFMTPEIRAPRP